MTSKRDKWNEEYAAGKWAFLHDEKEQPRLEVAAALVSELAESADKVAVVDLGCGEGQLYPYLDPERVDSYVGVDISDVALEAIESQDIPVETVCAGLDEFHYEPQSDEGVVLVACEVLTYDENSVDHLKRLVNEIDNVLGVVVSVVGPHPDKPNWTRASENFWKKMSSTKWPLKKKKSIRDSKSGVVWDVALHVPS